MRVLVTGASGLLGRAVYQQFKKNGHEGKLVLHYRPLSLHYLNEVNFWRIVIGIAHSRAKGDLYKVCGQEYCIFHLFYFLLKGQPSSI